MPERKTAREVIEEQMPGFHIVDRSRAVDSQWNVQADATSADLAALREKYLGGSAADASADAAYPSDATFATDAADTDTADTSAIILVEPDIPNVHDRAAGPKAVVVSEGEIVGRQG